MDLYNKQSYIKCQKLYKNRLITFIAACLFFIALYVLSFFANMLWLSLVTGIIACLVCSMYYFLFVAEQVSFKKLFDSILSGISQTDTYVFIKHDGFTSREGLRCRRLTFTYRDGDGRPTERTLYTVLSAEQPTLTENEHYIISTHSNIITSIKKESDT